MANRVNIFCRGCSREFPIDLPLSLIVDEFNTLLVRNGWSYHTNKTMLVCPLCEEGREKVVGDEQRRGESVHRL